MNNFNLHVVRDAFGRLVYTHKAHEKNIEILSFKSSTVKWVNILLTALTSGTLISTFFSDYVNLIYISSIFSFFVLFFVIFQISFNPNEKLEKHRVVAKELWFIKEKYIDLISGIMNGSLSNSDAILKKKQLSESLAVIYKFAPNISNRAYKKARKALQIDDEATFTEDEIDSLLPLNLKQKDKEIR